MPVTQNVIRLLGRYSEGLRLAAVHGPRSGVVFEYAYQNHPHGTGALGRWIDRTFLQLSAWDGIRQRVQTSKELIAELLARRRADGNPTLILDVASGTARYLRELVREKTNAELTVVCRDRDPRRGMHGRELVAAEGLPRFTFSVGAATDDSSYLTNHDPDMVLAIGLFPYLQRDDAVRTVMRLSFSHLRAGACLVCTTLTKVDGGLAHWEADAFAAKPVIRPTERIAEWLRAEGFVNVEQRFSQPHGVALVGWKPD